MCLRIENFVRDFSLCPYMQFSERCFFFASALSFSMKNRSDIHTDLSHTLIQLYYTSAFTECQIKNRRKQGIYKIITTESGSFLSHAKRSRKKPDSKEGIRTDVRPTYLCAWQVRQGFPLLKAEASAEQH